MAFSKDQFENSVERDKSGCNMTSGELTAVLQGSKEGGLAVGDIVNGEQSMILRGPEKLIQQDIMNLQ